MVLSITTQDNVISISWTTIIVSPLMWFIIKSNYDLHIKHGRVSNTGWSCAYPSFDKSCDEHYNALPRTICILHLYDINLLCIPCMISVYLTIQACSWCTSQGFLAESTQTILGVHQCPNDDVTSMFVQRPVRLRMYYW